jgi:hypothetical protein
VVARQVAMNLSSTATVRAFRRSGPVAGWPNSVDAGARRIPYNRAHPAVVASRRNNNIMGHKTLEYNLDVLSILGLGHLGNRASQAGSGNAHDFGYLMLSGLY